MGLSDDEDEFQQIKQMMKLEGFKSNKEKQAPSVDDFLQKTKKTPVGPPRPGPPRPDRSTTTLNNESNNNNEHDHSQEKKIEEDPYKIPHSHEVILKNETSTRMISCLSCDPAGARLVTGSFDSQLRFWDFAGMTQSFQSFRNISPAEGNQMLAVAFSKTGDKLLACPATATPLLFDRDGHRLSQCIKGDMYIQDLNRTKGHTNQVNHGEWDALKRDKFWTCSADSTLRLWNVETMEKGQESVVRHRNQRGHKVAVQFFSAAPTGSVIVAAAEDATFHVWDARGSFSRAQSVIKDTHASGCEVTSLKLSQDGHTLISRAVDDTLKVWDVRNSKSALAVFSDLPNHHLTRCIFSPDDRLIVTGTCVKKGEAKTSLLVFFDKTLLQQVQQIGVAKEDSVVSMEWHPRINQIFVGTHHGNTHVMYDPTLSTKGALLCAKKRVREADPNDFVPSRPIITPHALPMFQETLNSKRQDARDRYDPSKSGVPVPDVGIGHGKSGKVGTTTTQILMKKYIKKVEDVNFKDPRDAFLRHAKEAEENPVFFGNNAQLLDEEEEPSDSDE